ncbi:LamG-like jellyroll fold domain-containing protein [Myceligenerans xiligouense]|uniref:PKD domain-containing protein n=1 Tax=Myceligenerans xiligouense TaxID=253184 RepID=A0A3N4YIU6_9MICO|nr:LamG-like jellyroll fold domain-containing protein [Myceligenerans xiligouense]RPF20693.1 PKD domain-containing protein [Myceligenerans xiligouense]
MRVPGTDSPTPRSLRHPAALVAAGATAAVLTASLVTAPASAAPATGHVAASAAGAMAAPAEASADLPATVSSDPLPTVQIDGVAWTQVVVGDTVYVGGSFSSARPAGAAPGTDEVPRGNLLAYDLATGELDPTWSPTVNGEVKGLALSPDGSVLYAVGPFTSVDGVTRYRSAAFDTATGSLTSFRPAVNGPVYAVATSGDDVFLGGAFSSVNNTARARVAAVDAATGATTRPFAAAVGNRSVQALTAAPDGGSVVIGGNFTSVDGSSDPGYGLARLDAATGDMLPLPVNDVVRNAGDKSAVLALASDDDHFYGTGYHYGGGGTVEGSFAASWDTGELVWIEDCHGDTYSIFPFRGAAYQASHKHYCGNSGGFPETSPRSYYRGTAVTLTVEGTNTADIFGYPDHPGTPRPEFLNWYPDFSIGTYTGLEQGPWHVTASGDYVLYGGEFLRVNNQPQQGLVRFAVRDVAPNADGPRLGGASFPLSVSSPAGGVVRLTWPGNHDRDDRTLTYSVYRDTSSAPPVAVVDATASFWETEDLTALDVEAAPGSTHRYAVVARDPWGNTAWSDWVETTVADGEPLGDYARDVLLDGATHYWRMGGTSGPVTDLAGAADLTAGTDVTFGTAGALAVDTDTAVTTDGTIDSRSWTTGTARPGPQTFSVETWFRTTTPGGKLIGFGDRGSRSTSAEYDRHLYVDAAGKLVLGVHPGAVRTVASPTAVTDGAWHHAAGTLGPDGLRLYLDGELVASDPDTTGADTFSGFWRVGGDNLDGWSPSSPNRNFTGEIDEVAVYGHVLTPEQVSLHHVVGLTGEGPNQPPVAEATLTAEHLTLTADAGASTDPDGEIVSYAWDLGDGATADGPAAEHTYAEAGTYEVTVTVTDDDGAQDTYTQDVTATDPPPPDPALARDTFTRTVTGGWGAAETGGAWTLGGSASRFAVDGSAGTLSMAGGLTLSARLGDVSATATDVTVRTWAQETPSGNSYLTVQGRRVGGDHLGGRLKIFPDGHVDLHTVRNGTPLAGGTVTGLAFAAGDPLLVRVQVTGTSPATIRARAWAEGSPEPTTWQAVSTDTTASLQEAGSVGLALYTGGSTTSAWGFDDLVVMETVD